MAGDLAVSERPGTWGDLLNEVRAAIDSADWERGEEAIEWMQQEAAHQGDLGQESSALFYEGMLADAKGELDRAEGCFAEAVEVDRRHYGPVHAAVGDSLGSLALVRVSAGKTEAAAKSYEQAADIYQELAMPMAAEMFVRAGNCWLQASGWDEAEEMFDQAVGVGADAFWVRTASLGLYQSYTRREMLLEALSACAWATQQPSASTPEQAKLQARLWCNIGHLSFRFGLDAQCAFSYGCVFALTDDEAMRTEAEGCLAELGQEAPTMGDDFVVVHADEEHRFVHVAHKDRGLWVVNESTGFVLGDVVELDLAGARPRVAHR